MSERIKKLLYRCHYMGTKENEVLLKRYIITYSNRFIEEDYHALETLLTYPDPTIYLWLTQEIHTAPLLIQKFLKKYQADPQK